MGGQPKDENDWRYPLGGGIRLYTSIAVRNEFLREEAKQILGRRSRFAQDTGEDDEISKIIFGEKRW